MLVCSFPSISAASLLPFNFPKFFKLLPMPSVLVSVICMVMVLVQQKAVAFVVLYLSTVTLCLFLLFVPFLFIVRVWNGSGQKKIVLISGKKNTSISVNKKFVILRFMLTAILRKIKLLSAIRIVMTNIVVA